MNVRSRSNTPKIRIFGDPDLCASPSSLSKHANIIGIFFKARVLEKYEI